jgi:16S rRNA (guanine527-N7)-methyltransferase
VDLILKYFPDLKSEQLQKFEALFDLYKDWNAKINVVSRKDINNLYLHHILHSLAIAKIVSFNPGSDIVDVGTGGGFPGLPLALMFPEVNFLLVESIGKKLQVVDAICQELDISNIQTKHCRVEELSGQFDFAVSRAVTKLDIIWSWIRPKLKTENYNELPNGLLYLKGGDISAELPKDVIVRRWELNQWFSESYFSEKVLVLLSPTDAK